MNPEQLRALLDELGCTPRQLADTLGVPHREVMDWQVEKRFPTKRHVQRMKQLVGQGPGALAPTRIVARRAREQAGAPIEALDDPAVWGAIRKLLAHPDFRKRVLDLAEEYDEPGEDPSKPSS